MAFNVQQINPLDLQPRKAVGVSLPFSSTSVFNSTYTTQDALKSNLVNHFLTEKGERFLNPNLGAGLRRLLFDQMTVDKRDEIEAVVRTEISTWFPNLVVNTTQVVASPDTNTVTVYIKYSVTQTNIQDELLINFEQ
jgi:phage baseplate assembly protein W